MFTVEELAAATNDFARERLVGAGGCGEVFEAGAYTRSLVSSTCSVTDTQNHPTHPTRRHPLAPP